jgi:hypothetical protein
MEATEPSSSGSSVQLSDVIGVDTVLDLLDSAVAAAAGSSPGPIVPDVLLSYTDVLLIRTCLRKIKSRLLDSGRLRCLLSEDKSVMSLVVGGIQCESDTLKPAAAAAAADVTILASARQSATHHLPCSTSATNRDGDVNRSPSDDPDDNDDLECDSCVYIAMTECVCDEDDRVTGRTEAARVSAAIKQQQQQQHQRQEVDGGSNVATSTHRTLTDPRQGDAHPPPSTSDVSSPVKSFGCQTDFDTVTFTRASALGASSHRNVGLVSSVLVDKLMNQNARLKKALRDVASRRCGSTHAYLVSA